jgi:hypothetical protein
LVYYWHQRARSNDSGNSSPIWKLKEVSTS